MLNWLEDVACEETLETAGSFHYYTKQLLVSFVSVLMHVERVQVFTAILVTEAVHLSSEC